MNIPVASGAVLTIIGSGNGAHTMAADWVSRGYRVRMYARPESMEKLGALAKTLTIKSTGLIEAVAKIDLLTSEMEEAIAGVKYIAVVTTASAHEDIARSMKGIVKSDQVVILYPGAFSSMVFKSILGEDCPVIVETNNLPYDTRLKKPCEVYCTGINPVKLAFFPSTAAEKYLQDLQGLHTFSGVYTDILECGLSLVNPSVHSGPCLINVGMIEQPSRGAFHMYEHFTPGAAKIDVAIDRERKAIGRAFGYDLRPLEDFAQKPQGHDITWQEIYMQMHGDVALTQISGPDTIWNRYLTEDCPNGLVPWSELGKLCKVKTPVIDSVINIYSQVHERDWRRLGVTARKLGLAGMTIAQIKEYLKSGKAQGIDSRLYKGIAFDFDHTLYDRKETYRNMLEAYRVEFAEILDPKYLADDEAFLKALVDADYQGVYRGGWRGIHKAMMEMGVFVKDPGYERLASFVGSHYPDSMVVYPDLADTITWLKRNHYTTGIITNGPVEFQNSKVNAIHGAEIFDHVLVAIESGAEKPDPAPFMRMAEMMGIEPEELLYVGDNPRNDIEGARNAGCTPVWIRSVNIWIDKLDPPIYAIDSIGEIRTLLDNNS